MVPDFVQPSSYVAEIVEYMWANDVLLIAVPFVAGMFMLKFFPQYFPQYAPAKVQSSNKLQEAAFADAEENFASIIRKQADVSVEPLLQSSQALEADLQKELEGQVLSKQQMDVVDDGMAQLHADMMTDLVAEEDEEEC